MEPILHLGLRPATQNLLHQHFEAAQSVRMVEALEPNFTEVCQALSQYQVLLLGEQVSNPIRFAQQAYSHDKSISILLITDGANHEKIKRAMQFSPFIGPTVQCISGDTGIRMFPIVADALQRTSQRRSFAKLKTAYIPEQRVTLNVLEKVRADFTSKLLQEAPIGVVLISETATVISINHYALSLLGKSEKDVLGTAFYFYFPENEQEDVKQFLLDGFLGEPKKVFARQEETGQQYLEFTVAPIDIHASAGYKMIILNNITSTVIARQQTEAHLEELKLLNANLARVNADLDTFVYTASHDLKAPMLNIEALVRLLEKELGPTHPGAVELEHIKRSVASFKQTVEELTEISRIQKGFDQEAVLLDIELIFAEVMQLLEKEIAEAGARVGLQAAGTTKLFFSKKNLTSILYNLISNAIKYRAPGRAPQVQVQSRYEEETFYLSVQDNGLGIPAAKQVRIFNLFQRMHNHVSGTGVGLFIVKRIVENSGGQVTVKSQEGQGSVFEVQLKGVKPEV